jgi:hypothetical protein
MTNPSDRYLDLVNSDFGGVETVDQIIDSWEQGTNDAGDIDLEHQRQSDTGKSFSCSKQIFLARPPLTWILACDLPWSLYCCPRHELYFCVCVLKC